jgi:hypothetical protein
MRNFIFDCLPEAATAFKEAACGAVNNDLSANPVPF